MNSLPKVSLEQWAVLKAVAEEGSFSRAAELLNKSQSAVSYALAGLESLLPTKVLQRVGRRTVLTESGRVLYERAKLILDDALELEASAARMAEGWEAEITLAVDILVDMQPLLTALDRFSKDYPNTRIRVLETALSGTDEALLEKRAELVLGPHRPPGYAGTLLTDLHMLAVAHPSHKLFSLGRDISNHDLQHHRQVVVRDSGQKREQDSGWLGSAQRWTVTSFASSVSILKANMGFAFVPESWVKTALESGELRVLPLENGGKRHLSVYLIHANQNWQGPGEELLAKALLSAFRT